MANRIVSIGYGRQLFLPHNDERRRLALCAQKTAGMHHIIFSHASHKLQNLMVDRTFSLYATNSYLTVLSIIDAVRIGLRIIKKNNKGEPWVITAQDPFGAGIAAYVLHLLSGCPFVLQEHGDFFSGDYWRRESLGNRLWLRIACFLLRRADRVRAVSMRVKMHLVSLGVDEQRVVMLPVYTDIERILHKEPVENLRRTYPEATCIVLSLARFVTQKNLPMLLSAFASLRERDSRALLVLVGSGPLEARIREDAERLGITSSVILRPWSDDPHSLMKTADVYALSSNFEGWGRVLIEAMASGLPAVTTEVGCVGEAWESGLHGLAVPVGDARGFAVALTQLAGDSSGRERMSAEGLSRAKGLVESIDSYAGKWADAFTFSVTKHSANE